MIRAAIIQMRSGVDPQANIEAASVLIRAAASDGATLIATPEMTGFLQRKPNDLWATIQSQDNDICVKAFSALAAELGVHLLIGSLAILTGEKRAANRSFVFGPDGGLISTYDKIHMFDVSVSRRETWRESAIYDAGKKMVMADIGEAVLGLTVCYDLRFSKLYRLYAQAGAQIISVPSAFTVPTGRAHWASLLKARAIESASYILAPNQGGLHEDGRSTWGHSEIVGPWGEVVARLAHNEPGFACADLDMEAVATARAKIPAWNTDADFENP